MINVLFVCTGNTCRSPMAEALLNHMKENDLLSVKSAGVYASDGGDASLHAKQALDEKGIICNHQSAQLNEEHIRWATYILTMTESHKELIFERYPQAIEKTFTLSEFVVEDGQDRRDVIDPFGGSLEIYRMTREDLEKMIKLLVKKLEN
ncbi:low molecular weight protein arginine phosphatase [Peribacillus frigoritolerans]|uniref:low molecular weight protein arginine phosphatase n=1 Tax=Peribacillus frigoritolerans TaxID=450367 RepID=UPI00105A7018|nr:low molecular weight protein arginine phosphatase [Peribacillus frigoritolerans]TDL79064.1 low molecular weight protein arginine phosphatase [Peribacillus frigoritolerans]